MTEVIDTDGIFVMIDASRRLQAMGLQVLAAGEVRPHPSLGHLKLDEPDARPGIEFVHGTHVRLMRDGRLSIVAGKVDGEKIPIGDDLVETIASNVLRGLSELLNSCQTFHLDMFTSEHVSHFVERCQVAMLEDVVAYLRKGGVKAEKMEAMAGYSELYKITLGSGTRINLFLDRESGNISWGGNSAYEGFGIANINDSKWVTDVVRKLKDTSRYEEMEIKAKETIDPGSELGKRFEKLLND